MTLWEVDVFPAEGQPDRQADALVQDAAELGIVEGLQARSATTYLLQGTVSQADVDRLAGQLLTNAVIERAQCGEVGSEPLLAHPDAGAGNTGVRLVHVLPKPGVTDPVAKSALEAMRSMGMEVTAVRTARKFWLSGVEDDQLRALCEKVMANDSIEQVVVGPLRMTQLDTGAPYTFERLEVAIRALDDDALMRLSREGQLYLSLEEMRTIRAHFETLGREPTDIELETVAQTWSEHCSHKTLKGRIAYEDERGTRHFENMLKETVFAATQEVRAQLGDADWCVSVFEDNAGIVRFDDETNVVFKVETHNHPSAIEPYGGANTGIGGVIRDPMGTGMGAKPVCNTDVFCFASPDTPVDQLPPGVLHPRRVMKGVVAGVRDYGNRMGIPTVNGAIYFDDRYLGNPLVYCGNVGILPRDKSTKQPATGDLIVALGGRTGRDGIHGATFSSTELSSESESASGGAVQIGNAITEKMLLDVLLAARDQQLYSAVTDCGAGGFSSAVGEMGEKIGAEVWLERAPLKYEGLTYTEIWISEAQERMVLAVPEERWEALRQLCESEGVEATAIGRFTDDHQLTLKYNDQQVGQLSMAFLHDGRPPVIRSATYVPPPLHPVSLPAADRPNWTTTLEQILGSYNVASKEWVIRQYDHEVQGGSVIKPLVGVHNDGPGDAAVVRPRLDSMQGLAVSCGMNPHYGDFDTYHMAAGAIDEAVRNCVAVGADPTRISILDNFCWGNTDRPETLGSLVRAALACRDVAVALGTPFISGKDSLNNEFAYKDADGQPRTIRIPPTLLISALGLIDDVRRCVTMDLKRPGNQLFIVGDTRDELGGSHLLLVEGGKGGAVPQVDASAARQRFAAMHAAIQAGAVRACHDLSEGGLAVALAEMAFAGGYGAEITLNRMPSVLGSATPAVPRLLFAESHSRFLCEVAPDQVSAFEAALQGVPFGYLGEVTGGSQLIIRAQPETEPLVAADISALKACWQKPLAW